MTLLAEPVSHSGSILICSLSVSFSPVHSALFDSWEVSSMTFFPPPFTVTSFHLPSLPFSSFALSPRLKLSHNKPLLHCVVWISLCLSLGPQQQNNLTCQNGSVSEPSLVSHARAQAHTQARICESRNPPMQTCTQTHYCTPGTQIHADTHRLSQGKICHSKWSRHASHLISHYCHKSITDERRLLYDTHDA